MNPIDPRLKGLARISGVMRDAALVRLSAASAQLHRIEDEIAALDAAARQSEAIEDIAVLAATGAARARWHAVRRAELSAKLEKARARKAALLQEARSAVGREAAVERLAKGKR